MGCYRQCARININSNNRFQLLCGKWKRKRINKAVKEKLLKLLEVLYGAGCWILSNRNMTVIRAAEMGFQGSLYGWKLSTQTGGNIRPEEKNSKYLFLTQ